MPCFSSYELLLFWLRTTARSRFGVAILAQVAWARLGPGPVWARFGAMDAVLRRAKRTASTLEEVVDGIDTAAARAAEPRSRSPPPWKRKRLDKRAIPVSPQWRRAKTEPSEAEAET